MTRHLLVLIFGLSSIIASGQLQADSLIIYKDFKGRGTTANLWHWHHDADSLKIPLQKLSDADLITLKGAFADVKPKKYFQQKHGGRLFLGFVYLNGQKYKCAIGNYPTSVQFVNLSDRKQLILKDSIKVTKVNALFLKFSE